MPQDQNQDQEPQPQDRPLSQMRENLSVDRLVDSIGSKIPMLNEEVVYKYELEKQSKISLFIAVIGLMMMVLGYLL